ncbi:Na+/H+ antiporter NhaC family protein [Hyphomonas johnsonii]|uniref:Na+/H+ antiporter NhaC n=1 Tax=Hyphomonas johnsonii MHS-2 TaxID=1280950 RepID=A0A059FQ31_9PROT|nr:Na+/H+ antiporter NhaC family protein [Hyphomonas johnsonii]KCZ92732.1 Na+/H+ antiporter NhaC [Hyphomonas johnsonii MHS-2]
MLTRNVYAALGLALLASETLIAGFNPAMGALGGIDRAVGVFDSTGNAQVLLFCLLIGALIAWMRDSGGVEALVSGLMKRGLVSTPRRAALAPALAGTAIFVETNVSLLSSGVLGQRLFDAHGLSRERLAYIIDSTSAPISALILLNGWGAYALGLVEPYGFDSPIGVVAGTIPWNFYALLTLAGVYLTVFTGRVFGPMKTAASKVAQVEDDELVAPTRAIYMWLPLIVMIGAALGFMAWTGGGNILAGSGSQSILWAVCLALVVAGLLLVAGKAFPKGGLQARGFAGISEMVPVVAILFLSIALGDSLRVLGTGAFLSSVAAQFVSPIVVPAVLFAVAGVTAFMTGTSWGTYGIMIPIAMPLAMALGIPPSLALAAVLGGGVFGDHCSPISDTTIIASLAAGCDHIDHVRTQMPYALVAGGFAVVMYLIAGLVVSL